MSPRPCPPEAQAPAPALSPSAPGTFKVQPLEILVNRAPLHLQFLRRVACREQGGLCFYCGRPMTKPTAEHLIAKQDGGRDTRANIAATCAPCNHARHADPTYRGLSVEEYAWTRLFVLAESRDAAGAQSGLACQVGQRNRRGPELADLKSGRLNHTTNRQS